MMIKDDLLSLVPCILRARGWRLYTKSGRLVDLWQYGGRALLGHNPPLMLRAVKNNAERGLYAPYPHFANERFCKALSALLPDRVFRVYESDAFLRNVISAAGLGEVQRSMVWRPFLPKELASALQAQPFLVPVLPCPFPGAPAVLALDTQKANGMLEQLPPSQILSPVTLAAAARCIYDLLAVPSRGTPRFPKIDNALRNNKTWKREEIYFSYTPVGSYAGRFTRFLEAGFLLPPSAEEPAILPGELSPGEEAKLAELIGSI